MFDVLKHGSDVVPKWVAPKDEQEPYESRWLWCDLMCIILAKDMDTATCFFELRKNRWVLHIQSVLFLYTFLAH